jgi:hypothetical protein
VCDSAEEEAPFDFYGYSVPLWVRREKLLGAARAWDQDNGPFPER